MSFYGIGRIMEAIDKADKELKDREEKAQDREFNIRAREHHLDKSKTQMEQTTEQYQYQKGQRGVHEKRASEAHDMAIKTGKSNIDTAEAKRALIYANMKKINAAANLQQLHTAYDQAIHGMPQKADEYLAKAFPKHYVKNSLRYNAKTGVVTYEAPGEEGKPNKKVAITKDALASLLQVQRKPGKWKKGPGNTLYNESSAEIKQVPTTGGSGSDSDVMQQIKFLKNYFAEARMTISDKAIWDMVRRKNLNPLEIKMRMTQEIMKNKLPQDKRTFDDIYKEVSNGVDKAFKEAARQQKSMAPEPAVRIPDVVNPNISAQPSPPGSMLYPNSNQAPSGMNFKRFWE